jgi:DNA-binding NarL/FixJ family response regulator
MTRPTITQPEVALLRMLADGLSDQAIARRCGISTRTVGRRLSRLQAKLGSRSRFALGVEAARRGLLEVPAGSPAGGAGMGTCSCSGAIPR